MPLTPLALYLDTTYANPRFKFAPQADAIRFCADAAAAELSRDGERVLILVATYSMGKERVLVAIHRATGRLIGVDETK
jgi:DNA cross-link repair 1A protein